MSGHRQAISGDKITILDEAAKNIVLRRLPVCAELRPTHATRNYTLYNTYRYRPPTALPPLPKNIINKYEIMSYTYTAATITTTKKIAI